MGSLRKNSLQVTKSSLLKFLIPSLLGMFLFLCPLWVDGNINIPLGVISSRIASFIKPFSNWLLVICVGISSVFSLIYTLVKPSWTQKESFWRELFVVSPLYLVIRIIGAIITFLVATERGPQWLLSADTGGSMIHLMGTLVAWFFAASFLIPLLMDYGIMDFTGTLLRNVLKPLFRLPGRAAIDLLASWVGNCNVGVVLTTQQYETGYYTDREAILIATCFSATSLPFCLVIAAMMGVDQYFAQLYLLLSLVGVLSAAIMSRIWPLQGKWKDQYYPPVGRQVHESEPVGISRSQWALQQALARAKSAPDLPQLILRGIKMFLNIVFTPGSGHYVHRHISLLFIRLYTALSMDLPALPLVFPTFRIGRSSSCRSWCCGRPGGYVYSCDDLFRHYIRKNTVYSVHSFSGANYLPDRSGFHYAQFQNADYPHRPHYHFP